MVRAGFRAGQLHREQAADAKEPGLQRQRLGRARRPARPQFGQPLHRPDVVLVTQGAKEPFPQGLLPARLSGPRLELGGLARQPHAGRLVEKLHPLVRIEFPQRGATLPAKLLRQPLRRLRAQPQAQFPQRRIQDLPERQHRRGARHRPLAFPHDVQNDLLEGRVPIMAVGAPPARTQVHLHVARLRGRVPKLNAGAPKIGSALDTLKTRMKHPHGLIVEGSHPVAEQTLVLPDRLKQALRRRVPALVQNRDDPVAHAPLGIEAGQDWKHRARILRLAHGKSSLKRV